MTCDVACHMFVTSSSLGQWSVTKILFGLTGSFQVKQKCVGTLDTAGVWVCVEWECWWACVWGGEGLRKYLYKSHLLNCHDEFVMAWTQFKGKLANCVQTAVHAIQCNGDRNS